MNRFAKEHRLHYKIIKFQHAKSRQTIPFVLDRTVQMCLIFFVKLLRYHEKDTPTRQPFSFRHTVKFFKGTTTKGFQLTTLGDKLSRQKTPPRSKNGYEPLRRIFEVNNTRNSATGYRCWRDYKVTTLHSADSNYILFFDHVFRF